jgi:hypothetical protein
MTLLQLEVPLVALSLEVTVTVPQPPEVVPVKGLGAGTALKHWTVVPEGQVIVGGPQLEVTVAVAVLDVTVLPLNMPVA